MRDEEEIVSSFSFLVKVFAILVKVLLFLSKKLEQKSCLTPSSLVYSVLVNLFISALA